MTEAPERTDLNLASKIRDEINEILARYDIPSDVYQRDARIDAACVMLAQAAIAALEPMDKPRVKPLAWKLDDNRTAYAQRQYFADRYCIEHRLHGDDVFDLWIGPDAVKATRHATLEAAKAAAQADYEASILAALE